MSQYAKTALASLVLAAACWTTDILINPPGLEWLLAVAAMAFSILSVCFFAICLSLKLNPRVSPYRIFALTDGFIGLCVLLYAIYDIMTDTGWFAGLVGTLLLLTVVPVTLLLLLADFVVWKQAKSRMK